jgi:hypothetical protein
MLEHAEKAVSDNSCYFGVKGPIILSTIPSFDLARGFVPDYMHAVLLGVVRQFVFLWFDSKHHDRTFYLGRRRIEYDNLLKQLRPPSEIKRLPRSLDLRNYWKASEWRNFLLFYSIHLRNFLPKFFLIIGAC